MINQVINGKDIKPTQQSLKANDVMIRFDLVRCFVRRNTIRHMIFAKAAKAPANKYKTANV